MKDDIRLEYSNKHGFFFLRNGKKLNDDDELTPQEISQAVRVRIDSVYRWLHHPTTCLPHRKEGFLNPFKYFVKVKDLKEYFKLRMDKE
jgi:hypothetical protein